MTIRPLSIRTLVSTAAILVGAQLAAGAIEAQTATPAIVGAWRAEAPLPNGVVQTFRFDMNGNFELAKDLAVDGTYRVEGNQLVETVTLPSVGVSHTDTAIFAIAGDSLVVNERSGAPARVLRHVGPASPTQSIVGDWTIQIGSAMAAHYMFDSDGTMHVRARVGDEQGKYLVRADTLHLSNDQSFQLPAIARFAIADSVLTLTPPDGKQPRHFHKVPAR